jgi:hypothetical protein
MGKTQTKWKQSITKWQQFWKIFCAAYHFFQIKCLLSHSQFFSQSFFIKPKKIIEKGDIGVTKA